MIFWPYFFALGCLVCFGAGMGAGVWMCDADRAERLARLDEGQP